MSVARLNHAVLWVRNAERTATFFEDNLSFARANSFPGAVFLKSSADSPNDHDLGVFEVGAEAADSPGRAAVGMYHLAWEVPTLGELIELRQHMRLTIDQTEQLKNVISAAIKDQPMERPKVADSFINQFSFNRLPSKVYRG